MRGEVSGAVPVCYVRNVDQSIDFYALFGFTQSRSGEAGEARWAYLQCADTTILLAAVHPPLITVELPLLIYLFVEDVAAVSQRLRQAGRQVDHVGYPDHAPGGEGRTLDADGNVVLFGQRTAIPADKRVAPTGERARFSLMQQAAEAVSRRGGAPAHCQIGSHGGIPCTDPAEVKLADPWGETVWGCMKHADEALITARSAFIATEDGLGLSEFLRHRRERRTD
jgi:catechol 2,3-dioxygenase-like lactoylglutathione lyase family enzyme